MDMSERLVFVIGAPRSGTTLLMRMLHAHPDIHTRPEPHLLTPLARLGYFGGVHAAPYDVHQASAAARALVAELPGGEQAYVDALRAYSDRVYAGLLEPSGKRLFVDKTPAYALELPFITRLYPRAGYVALTRHPFAVFSSYASSFFDDDWRAAHAHNPLLERYLPALARFIRERPVPLLHIRYEALVADPEAHVHDLCEHLGLPRCDAMVTYGDTPMRAEGLGDPIGVDQHRRPVTSSVDKWALQVKGHPDRVDLLHRAIARVPDEDLRTLGYTRESLWEPVEAVDADAADAARRVGRRWDRYHVERRALVALRRNIHHNLLGRALRVGRTYADILLRDGWTVDADRRDP